MITKLLISNRGEIACRIIDSAKKLGIKTVAIYSDIDRNSLHVKLADEAYCVGKAPSKDSYLQKKKIIDIAVKSQAEAIHPGYGFLAEDANFAELCNQHNLIFVGPSANAINQMGDKSAAKNLMAKAGVPIVPGYAGKNQEAPQLKRNAAKIGYPLLIKATAGGGGKGMRLVNSASEFDNALSSAKREALSSFDNDNVLLEKYIDPARHVEVQVFADRHGNAVHLFDRDCSLQRRHQKIIEEAPAPNLTDITRLAMGNTAIKAALAINYTGAGTIEFLVDADENYYFMEMNTRLQVEHPVTEKITGIDLVEWQLLVASNLPLPLKQEEIKIHGHAFEARICAENPLNNFSPSIGTLTYLHFPQQNKHTRIDTGITQHDSISPFYDPMIAKLITWDTDRDSALTRLHDALAQTRILGVNNNVSLLHKITQLEHFRNIEINTGFVDTHLAALKQQMTQHDELLVVVAAIVELQRREQLGEQLSEQSIDRHSPWFCRDNWRMVTQELQTLRLWHNGVLHTLTTKAQLYGHTITSNEHTYNIRSEWLNETSLVVIINNLPMQIFVVFHKKTFVIFYEANSYLFHLSNPNIDSNQSTLQNKKFTSPMPGTVIEVSVKPGQKVRRGDKLIVIEAMKMEHAITAPSAGLIEAIFQKAGDMLNEGDELLQFNPD
jgi:3-methylcrotonyl-CoA carboxylase alpha subunit